MYIFLFLEKNNNQIKLKHDFNDDPMNESPSKNAETSWDDEKVMHDSDHRKHVHFKPDGKMRVHCQSL